MARRWVERGLNGCLLLGAPMHCAGGWWHRGLRQECNTGLAFCVLHLQEALFEEIGIDSDKSVKADFEGARALLQPIKKMKR